MAGGVDEVEVVALAVAGDISERRRLCLDGDAALALEIHRVEDLLPDFPVGQAATTQDQAIGQGGFAMVDMGDDREITDMLHFEKDAAGP